MELERAWSMRALAVMLLGGLGWLVATAGDVSGCGGCADRFAPRKTVRGVLRPHVERPSALFENVWRAPDGYGVPGPAPLWKLEAGGRTYYLNLAGDRKLAELATKLSGKEIEVVAREFTWRVVPKNVVDSKGRSFAIAPPPPFDVPGLRVFELRPAQ
jgi:hypothetical protein